MTDRVKRILRGAWALSGEAGGESNQKGIAFLLSVSPDEATALMNEALEVTQGRLKGIGWQNDPVGCAVHGIMSGIELGIAAERDRVRGEATS